MSKTFRSSTLNQRLWLPPELRAWLPEGPLALFVSDVVDALDLSAIFAVYEQGDGWGQPPYAPTLRVKLLVYAYGTGRPSSRQVERATYEEVASRVLAAAQHPDHASSADFRKRHLAALANLFVQVLGLCQAAGLVKLGQVEEGIAQIQQGLAALRATGTEQGRTGQVIILAAAYAKVGQGEEGLSVVAEALAFVDKTGERVSEAELYRLKGELTLQQIKVQGSRFKVANTHAEAEACFLKASDFARQQQAKSLELRASMSLARLWQQQGKKAEARQLLAEIYGWFTEGFETKDLQEAKALLEELS